MKKNRLFSAILNTALLVTLPMALHAAEDPAKAVAAAIPANADQLPQYAEVFAQAKKLIDTPKTWDKIPSKVTLCIFSPEGAKGRAYDFAMSQVKELPKYTQIAKNMGIDLKVTMTGPMDMHIDMGSVKLKRSASTDVKFRVYTNEKIASEDFKTNQCDGVAMSTLRGKEYNHFVGSLDAIGAVPTFKHMTAAIQLLAKPEAAKLMVNQDYEVVSILPVGPAYIMVNDRKINTLAKAAGKRIAVLDYDKTQEKMVQQIGAQPVSVDLTTISGKFNNGQVDIIAGPPVIFKPFELYKGMTAPDGTIKGAIVRFPVVQLTGIVMMHRGKFPDGVGQLVRAFSAINIPAIYPFINEFETEIDPKYWMEVPAADKPGYTKLMRESRISLTKEGYYDKTMMGFLKRVRCQIDPTNYECSLNDE